MLLKTFEQRLEKLLPKSEAIEGDKVGIQLQSGRQSISKLMITMEITDEVVIEAKHLGIDCIVTFHPLIYRPLSEIIETERIGRIVTNLIQSSISAFSVHTIFDRHNEGTNQCLADLLNFNVESYLIPHKKLENWGMGLICYPKEQLTDLELVSRISQVMYAPVKYCIGKVKNIHRIAIVAGNGSQFINEALAADVDAFITADVSYHTFHLAKNRMMIIDPGHYEMEQFVREGLTNLLIKEFEKELELFISKSYTNPVSYFSNESSYNSQIEYLNNVKIKRYDSNGNQS